MTSSDLVKLTAYLKDQLWSDAEIIKLLHYLGYQEDEELKP